MPETNRVLRVLRQATINLRGTPGREGAVIHPTNAHDVLVAGDLHGNIDNFRKILATADLAKNPRRHLVLQEFVHGVGRYPNGGCTSHKLLDAVAALKCTFPDRVHLLIGNHELAEWTGRTIGKDGIRQNQLFALGLQAAYGERADELQERYIDLIAAMPLAVRTENRVLITHSIPPAEVLDKFDTSIFARTRFVDEQLAKGSSLYHLLWGRDTSEETSQRFAEMLDCDLMITGHISCKNGYSVPNSRRLILDSVGNSACCVLFPATEPITHQQLVEMIVPLSDD